MNDDLNPQLPPEIIQELRDFHRIEVPASTDASVILRGRAAISRNRRRRRLLQWAGAAASLAAMLAIAALVLHERRSSPAPTSIAMREDLDRSGRVDILDAMWLARRVGREPSQPAWDITGDGKVDQSDVDAIAASAVRLGGKS